MTRPFCLALLAAGSAVITTVTGCASNEAGDGESPGASDGVSFMLVEVEGPTTYRGSAGGAALIDTDRDGDLDLFVSHGYDVSSTPAPQDDRYYQNEGNGRFRTIGESALGGEMGFGSGQTWGDYDNDGDPDVFVAQQRGDNNLLYRNDGGGRFTRILEGPPVSDGGASYAASWVDIDSDGYLDLYVTNGALSSVATNFLYRNLGEGRFERVTDHVLVRDSAASAAPAWSDFDDDGDPDLFLARNWSPATQTSALYRNDGNWRFTMLEDAIPAIDTMPAVGAAWADYDNDGDMDLAVAVRSGMLDRLYRNEGGGRFTRVTEGRHVLDGSYSSSTAWLDADNDGDVDLLRLTWGEPAHLYTNLGNERFVRLDNGDLGRFVTYGGGSAIGDYDADGDLDIYEGSWPNWPGGHEEGALFRNEASGHHWLGIRLDGTRSNRSGIGARVQVRARIDGSMVTQTRELYPNTGFRTHHPLYLHFGLGDAERVDEVVVRWPSGTIQRVEVAAIDQIVTVTEADAS